MKILITPDKFKGSATAARVGAAIKTGLLAQRPDADIRIQPMADGGDGSLAVLASCLALSRVEVATCDPLGRPITATYLGNSSQAFIEVASASGLVLLDEAERDPLQTSTYGTGLMIKHALESGRNDIYLLLGGSATNDLGLGVLRALGYHLYDKAGNSLSGKGANLIRIHHLEAPAEALPDFTLTLLCDVTNPVYGPQGAARVYAAQKGASRQNIVSLEAGMQQAVSRLEIQFGRPLRQLPGGGAAGGIGAGLVGVLDAKLQPGFSTLARLVGLENQIREVDIVITGEGKLDEQSLQGKVVDGVAALCRKHGKPLHVIAGVATLTEPEWRQAGISSVSTVLEIAKDEADAIAGVEEYLTHLAAKHSLF